MGQGHIWVSDQQDVSTLAARLVLGDSERNLWFTRDGGPLPVAAADSFLLGSLLLWMKAGTPVHVHGPVTKTLLAGLEEWQSAWARWRPDRYTKVAITADDVLDATPAGTKAIAAFSGGVDACFTARRHLNDAAGWQRVDLRAAALVHGFDVPLDQPETFEAVRLRATQILGDLELVIIRTNLRELGQDWEDGFALAVAACLNLMSPEYGIGLIGSSEPYDGLVLPWGSNPVTDHLASTGNMTIRHDGAGYCRTEKVALLADWQEARHHLRVCWQGEELERNCGRCEKCVRTILNFRAVGAGLPAAFDSAPTDRQIAATALPNPAVISEWQSVAAEARRRGTDGSWVRAVDTAVRRSRMMVRLRAGKQRVKQTVRP